MKIDLANNPLGLDASRVIERSIYTDPAIYAAEQERIFSRSWQWIAHDSEIPELGDYVTATIAGQPIVVCRGNEGQIAAFLNTCTHRGALLAPRLRGNNGGAFVCFYHGWCFGDDGKLMSVPLAGAYGDNLRRGCYDVPPVRHDVFAGNIFVNMDQAAGSLPEFLGDAGAYLERYTGKSEALGRVRWVLNGNWKLLSENYRDNYHPMFAHPLVGSNYQGVKIEGANVDLSGRHGLLAWPSQGNREHIRRVMSKITGRQVNAEVSIRTPPTFGDEFSLQILGLFPNLGMQNFPKPRAENVLEVVRPLTVDTSIVETVVFGDIGESVEERQGRLDRSLDAQTSAGKIAADDAEAARRCSAGFSARGVRWSNMDRGQASGAAGAKNDEYTLRAFHRAYREYMGDAL